MEKNQNTIATALGLSLVEKFIRELQLANDKNSFQSQVQAVDQQLYKQYAPLNYTNQSIVQELFAQSFKEAVKLDTPKQHSLADSMLRSTLGCHEKFAQQYLKIIDLTEEFQQSQKKKRIQQAKKKFASSNSHTDFSANTKPFMNKTKFAECRPVIENQYDAYIKTHLTFLDRPNPSVNNKQYTSKYTDNIAKKIKQLGGIEDTLGPIEHSLSAYELKKTAKKEAGDSFNNSSRKISPSPSRGNLKTGSRPKQNWLDKSRQMRETIASKIFI